MGLLPGPQKINTKCGETLEQETLNRGSTIVPVTAHATAT
jgi:hypothetical protein